MGKRKCVKSTFLIASLTSIREKLAIRKVDLTNFLVNSTLLKYKKSIYESGPNRDIEDEMEKAMKKIIQGDSRMIFLM